MAEVFETGHQPPLVVGHGALNRLPTLCRQYDVRSVLIVSDTGVAASGLVDNVADMLSAGVTVTRFIAPAGEPTVATVDDGAATVRGLEAPLVIGVGGGTALDIAKLVAALATSPGTMEDYLLARTAWIGRVPSVMIPTTAGTGSEVTRTAIIADTQGRKQWAWGEVLLPDRVVLDSSLTCSLPAALTGATGLDAFVHALEATTGQGRNRFIESSALQALRLIDRALPAAVADPNDLTAREDMQIGACLAGQAIDNGGTGLGHNIGHALGTRYHLPHGVAVTLGTEATLSWSIEGRGAIFTPPADALFSTSNDLPERFTALVDKSDFNAALRPFSELSLDADALAQSMQAKENIPMADNAARRPEGSDWRRLAHHTVALFEDRITALRGAEGQTEGVAQ